MLNTKPTNKNNSRTCKTSSLMKGLICVAGMYIGWFFFLIQTLDSISTNQTKPSSMYSYDSHSNGRARGSGSSLIQISNNGDDASSGKGDVDNSHSSTTNKSYYDNEHDNNNKQSKIDSEKKVISNTSNRVHCVDTNDQHQPKCTLLSNFEFDIQNIQQAIKIYHDQNHQKIKPLSAYIEQKMNDEVPNTGRRSRDDKDQGEPSQYMEPLPLRDASSANPDKLVKFEYPKVNSCHNLAAKFPKDAGLLFDEEGKWVYPNNGNHMYDLDAMEYAKYCPVDADPFLPWIHDVFPSNDGKQIHFIAQNKRRCNTGIRFSKALHNLIPQVTIMQPVSVARINNQKANEIAPELWSPESDLDGKYNDELGIPRYQLVPTEQAKHGDGDFTRFICRFHTLKYDEVTESTIEVILGETLSTYPTNYEFVNYRKHKRTMMTPRGDDNGLFWLSNLRFDCPVPNNGNLQESIGLGTSVLNDGTPSIYVDVIPIRTSPRFGVSNSMFTEEMVGESYRLQQIKNRDTFVVNANKTEYGFDAKSVFGNKHVLPRVEASGRWENIPVCIPPPPPPLHKSTDDVTKDNGSLNNSAVALPTKKPHTLSACLWASATFHTRGNDRLVTDTVDRLTEWLEYHLLVGFDHFYIFDNTGAHTNSTNLSEALSRFSDKEVTRIDWPHICCNNNKPGNTNTGERSSQYAAESACRQRYGQYTEWIANIDTDEYLVPMGKFNNMREVVDAAKEEGTHILSFMSTRAVPNYDTMYQYSNEGECGKKDNPLCLKKKDNITFIESYNCDYTPLPKPSWADRAKKQIYRPDYVLSHFVHYSTITKDILQTNAEANALGESWFARYNERKKSERFTDEINEAVMVHTKTTVPGNTKGYREYCRAGFVETWNKKCRVGFPIPNNVLVENASRPDGYKYNCYTNDKLTNIFIPKLNEALKKRLE